MKRQSAKITKKKGEYVRRILLDLDILDNSLKIGSDENFLYLPLSRELSSAEQELLPEETELIDFNFELQKKKTCSRGLTWFQPIL